MTALDEYVRKVVDAAPPLSMEQRERIGNLLRAPGSRSTSYVSAEQAHRNQIATAQAALDKLNHKLTEALGSCAVCQLPAVAHYQNDRAHRLVPMRHSERMALMEHYAPEIEAAEDALRNIEREQVAA